MTSDDLILLSMGVVFLGLLLACLTMLALHARNVREDNERMARNAAHARRLTEARRS